ncbi:hypothetical protein [Arenibaculum pallidiluteum]|uniref:hypothetical protein n=1 Tax=Arenibaculum pallidiluteum TaxID=2812559 RepID=UPI001A96AB3C|nr:hypothetical protein [Arenibaculum pallidiluteum]
MFGFLKRAPALQPPSRASRPPSTSIDPEAIFPEEAWAGPEPCEHPTVWRIETPGGTFYADAHSVEVVNGALILLDAQHGVLGVLDHGQWDRIAGDGPGAPPGIAARDAA